MPIRRTLFSLFVAAMLALAPDAHAKERSWDGEALEAHEWGTLTAVQGSDGVTLDGLRHEERDLPSFVHHLRDVHRLTGVSPKMETPVIYFYSPEARRVRVNVRFPKGLITQWYPAATSANGSGFVVNGKGQKPDVDRIPLRDGTITWGRRQDLEVLSRDVKEPEFPKVSADDPWRFCRQTQANALRVCHHNKLRDLPADEQKAIADKTGSWTVSEYERCLFYRGLGDFNMPLTIRVLEETPLEDNKVRVRLRIQNSNVKEPVRFHFLACVRGDRIGFEILKVSEFEGAEGGTCVLSMNDKRDKQELENIVRDMKERLVSEGLFTDEALAMVRTWQHGWLGDEGLRLLYVLPRAYVDRILPLKITTLRKRSFRRNADNTKKASRLSEAAIAKPWRVERVFVGRVDLLSPARESKLKAMTSDLLSPDRATREAALRSFDAMGRFAAPYLRRAIALAQDARSREALEAQLARHR